MLLIYGAAVACLAVPTARAQGGGTEPGQSYHRDLGYPVPDWTQFQRSEANESAIEPLNSATQHWGNIAPHDESDAPLCKWFSGGEHGSCKTDVSWLHAAVGIKKSFFQSALANYILRFHAYGACYRSTVVRRRPSACRPVPCHRGVLALLPHIRTPATGSLLDLIH